MSSKISYKTALTTSNYTPPPPIPPKHTFWEDDTHYSLNFRGSRDKKHYDALEKLKMSPTFQRKFAIFAENILCITDTNTEKGCLADFSVPTYAVKKDINNNIPGRKKAIVGLWFLYRQDGFTYGVVYECDDIDDPRTGWFYTWEHDSSCCGYSCDYFLCQFRYPPKRK